MQTRGGYWWVCRERVEIDLENTFFVVSGRHGDKRMMARERVSEAGRGAGKRSTIIPMRSLVVLDVSLRKRLVWTADTVIMIVT